VMNDRGMQALLSSKFKLGADASAAAGPVGRLAEGSTDWKMRAEVLTYSRARGLFAGVTVNGAVIHQDDDATRELYGRLVPFKTILTAAVPTPAGGEPFVSEVRKVAGGAIAGGGDRPTPAPNPPPSPAPNPAPEQSPTPAPTPTPSRLN
ncbi:MAG TPA: lipid-binding SYLF domain-containing protein, partial [Terriglobia bacterium]|nr:lipid-binding SYLF domain-containing protein [Terriglobia bacterium]